MNDELQTLSRMFTERLFRIPDYQRGYAWTEEQLEDFWSDLCQIEDDRNHYTGVLTLENVPQSNFEKWEEDQWIIRSKRYHPFYIVDGQQRLTTSIILISCITNTLRSESDRLNFTTKSEIEKKYLFDSKNGGASRSYIFGYEKDNPSYEFLKTEVFGEQSASDRQEETVYTNNLFLAKKYFSEKISEMDKNDIEKLFIKVTQNLLFNVFTISDEVDVCVAFETMNNRGKPLSHLELLKNRLIYLSTRLEMSDEESNDLRRWINDCWKVVYHNLGRNKNSPLHDDFFLRSHHFLTYVEPAPSTLDTDEKRRQYRKVTLAIDEPLYRNLLNDIFTFKSISDRRQESEAADQEVISEIHNYSMSLQNAVKQWYTIFNPTPTNDRNSPSFWLSKINKIPQPFIYPIILAIMLSKESESQKCKAFFSIERWLFINSIVSRYAGVRRVGVEMLSIGIKVHREEASINELIDVITNDTNETFNSEQGKKEIRDSLRSKNFYAWKPILYVLYEYNQFLQFSSKTEREKIDWDKYIDNGLDYASVEHIYPQKARGKYWTERFVNLTAANRDILKNVIGNLVPLSKPKNASLSNKSFPEKISRLGSSVGFAYGSYAENEIVDYYKEWTPQTILDRSLRLLDFIEQRWGLDFGKDSEKIKMLGLNFVKPQNRIREREIFSHSRSDILPGNFKRKKKV